MRWIFMMLLTILIPTFASAGSVSEIASDREQRAAMAPVIKAMKIVYGDLYVIYDLELLPPRICHEHAVSAFNAVLDLQAVYGESGLTELSYVVDYLNCAQADKRAEWFDWVWDSTVRFAINRESELALMRLREDYKREDHIKLRRLLRLSGKSLADMGTSHRELCTLRANAR